MKQEVPQMIRPVWQRKQRSRACHSHGPTQGWEMGMSDKRHGQDVVGYYWSPFNRIQVIPRVCRAVMDAMEGEGLIIPCVLLNTQFFHIIAHWCFL